MIPRHEPDCALEQRPKVAIRFRPGGKSQVLVQEDISLKTLGELRCTCRVAFGKTMAELYELHRH